MISKKTILFILDGWGYGEENVSNPFRFTKTPNLDYFIKNYPFCLLNASGYSVGLPSNTAGNCQVGHLTIGTGTVFYQPAVKINLAIENGTFYQNNILKQIINHYKAFDSKLHLIGLLSQNNNIADINHLIAILNFAKNNQIDKVYLHLFTDGLDSHPKSALNLIQNLKKIMIENNLPGTIATLCSRFYALDKTKNYFLRTQRAFLLLIEGKGNLANDPEEFLKNKYQQENFNDNLVEPTIFDQKGIIENNDIILFFHHESKNIFQLANAFLNPNFQEFKRPLRKNLFIASLVKYLDDIDYPILFEEQKIKTNLSRIIAENKLKQIKIIDESRKELLNFYFNGFFEEEHPDEIYKFLPSFDEKGQDIKQKTKAFFDYLKITLKEDVFNLIIANLPIFDIIGHTGDFHLAISMIPEIDKYIEDLAKVSLENNYSLILTSDHSNIEKMSDPKSGSNDTVHNLNPVPFMLIDKNYFHEKSKEELLFFRKKIIGSLADIAPTILDLMNITIPQEFIGKSLLKYF